MADIRIQYTVIKHHMHLDDVLWHHTSRRRYVVNRQLLLRCRLTFLLFCCFSSIPARGLAWRPHSGHRFVDNNSQQRRLYISSFFMSNLSSPLDTTCTHGFEYCYIFSIIYHDFSTHPQLTIIISKTSITSENKPPNKCCLNTGPASATLGQYLNSIWPTSRSPGALE